MQDARVVFSFGLLAIAVIVAFVTVAIGPLSLTVAQAPRANGKIAYIRNVPVAAPAPPINHLRVMDAAGSNASTVRDLTPDFSFAGGPHWSPDGTQIAFSARRDFNAPDQIHVMNPDGSGLRNLTGDSPQVKGTPSWSPDGSRIAFLGFSNGRTGLYIMDSDGGNQTLVTELEADPSSLSWSPDGSRLAYDSSPDLNDQGFPESDIFVMNADGSGQTRLTTSQGMDGGPDWSPDGSKIVFTSGREGSSAAIYMMNSDGSDQRPLITDHRCAPPTPPATPVVCLGDEHPTWSLDGTMIAFVGFAREDPGFSDIFVVDADGTNEKRLTHTPDFEWSPDWQPLTAGTEPPDSLSPSPEPTPIPTTSPSVSATPEFDACTEASPAAASPAITPPLATPVPSSTDAATGGGPSSSPSADLDTPSASSPIVTPPPVTPVPSSTSSEPDAPTPSPTPEVECDLDEAPIGTTEQTIALAIVGALAAGSVIALPAAALRRMRRKL